MSEQQRPRASSLTKSTNSSNGDTRAPITARATLTKLKATPKETTNNNSASIVSSKEQKVPATKAPITSRDIPTNLLVTKSNVKPPKAPQKQQKMINRNETVKSIDATVDTAENFSIPLATEIENEVKEKEGNSNGTFIDETTSDPLRAEEDRIVQKELEDIKRQIVLKRDEKEKEVRLKEHYGLFLLLFYRFISLILITFLYRTSSKRANK